MKKKFKEMANKGFTLVELIIVVAVIAVLAAVLAPQYLQYVERSRESNDLQVATNYMRAATIAMADLSTGTHSNDFNWYVFKWGYTTSGSGEMNMHIGVATETNGLPTGIDGGRRDTKMQDAMAEIMGWAEDGKSHVDGTFDISNIDRPQSAAGAESGNGGNSFIFYINSRTGQILVDKNSANWVTDIGVNAPLME